MTSRENFYDDWKDGKLEHGHCPATPAVCNGTAPCNVGKNEMCTDDITPLSCKMNMGKCVQAPYHWFYNQYNSCPQYMIPTGPGTGPNNMNYCYGGSPTPDSYTPTSVDVSNNFCGIGMTHGNASCPKPGNLRNICGSGPGVL